MLLLLFFFWSYSKKNVTHVNLGLDMALLINRTELKLNGQNIMVLSVCLSIL